MAAKQVQLDEIIGTMKEKREEEPEGEALAMRAQVANMSSISHKVC